MYLKYVLVSVVITFVIFPITGCSFHPWSSSTNKNAVNFPDKQLEAVVRKEIGKPDGSILISDLEKIIFSEKHRVSRMEQFFKEGGDPLAIP